METDREHARVLYEAPPTDIEDDMEFESDFERRSTDGSMMRGVHSRPASSLASHQYSGFGAAIDNRTNAAGVGGGGGGLCSRSASRAAQPSPDSTPSSSRPPSYPPTAPTPNPNGPSASPEGGSTQTGPR